AGYRAGDDVAIALDPAASEFYSDGSYQLKGEGKTLTAAQLVDMYESWVGRYPIIIIEDGMAEDDWMGWKLLTDRLGGKIQLVGAWRASREVQPAARNRSRARGRRLLRAGVYAAVKPASRAVHSGREIKARAPLAPPISPAAVHVYEDLDDYEAVASGERQGHFYGRNSNENRSMLEAALAELEGAEAAVSSASGMAALHMAILALAPRPTTTVATPQLYGGTMALLR